MFSGAQLSKMGIQPKYRASKANLYKAMAEAEPAASDSRADKLPLEMELGHRGYLYQICAECSFLSQRADGWTPIYLAARSYIRAGLPYGLALAAMSAGNPAQGGKALPVEDSRPAGYLFHEDFQRLFSRTSTEEDFGLKEINPHAQQQTWLCLAAARGGYSRDLLGDVLRRCRDTMEQHSHLPIGSLSIPVAAHVALFDAIEGQVEQSPALDQIFSGALAKRSEVIKVARCNTYLWERLRTRTTLIDLHLTILTATAIRYGLFTRETLHRIEQLFDQSDPLYRLVTAPVELAFQSLDLQ